MIAKKIKKGGKIKPDKIEKSKNLITKEMSLAELLQRKPAAVEVLFKAGMHCFGCSMARFETLEQGCMAHGLDVEKILNEINKDVCSK